MCARAHAVGAKTLCAGQGLPSAFQRQQECQQQRSRVNGARQLAGWAAADQPPGLSAARLSTLALPLWLLGQALPPQLASQPLLPRPSALLPLLGSQSLPFTPAATASGMGSGRSGRPSRGAGGGGGACCASRP